MLDLTAETGGATAGGADRAPTVASSGRGRRRLWAAIVAHRATPRRPGCWSGAGACRLGEELREIVARRLEQRARELCTGDRWDELTDDVLDGELDPWSAADEMLGPVDV